MDAVKDPLSHEAVDQAIFQARQLRSAYLRGLFRAGAASVAALFTQKPHPAPSRA